MPTRPSDFSSGGDEGAGALLLLVAHGAEAGDAEGHGRVGAEEVGEAALLEGGDAPQRVGDAEVSAPAADRRRGAPRLLDLVEGAGEGERVARERGAHRVRQVLAAAADAEGEEARHQGGEEPAQDPDREDDEDERPEVVLAAPSAPAASTGAASAGAAADSHAGAEVAPEAIREEGDGADERGEQGHEPHVQILH